MNSGSGFRRQPIVPSGVLGMAIFLAIEAMFFSGLITSLVVLRAQVLDWPPLDQPRLPVAVTGINTLVLLLSGALLQRALVAVRRAERSVVGWLTGTLLLGGLFLGVQGFEWIRLVGYGLTTNSSLYGAMFYTLVGAHALHALGGLGALGVVAARATAGRYTAASYQGMELCRMYWFFVVGIWPLIYFMLYVR